MRHHVVGMHAENMGGVIRKEKKDKSKTCKESEYQDLQ